MVRKDLGILVWVEKTSLESLMKSKAFEMEEKEGEGKR